ncbi:MAG: hypothetical protein WBA28_08970 [Microbacteriaceae bacterium]
MRTKSFLISTVAIALLFASGCVPNTPPAPPGSTETTSTTPTTTTPEPTPTTKPTLNELVVSTSGLGDLLIGGNAESLAASTELIYWDAEYCVRPDGETTEANPGRWATTYDDARSFYGDLATPFFVDAHDGIIHRIDIFGEDISDAKGIHIGSTRDQLLAAHPGMTVSYEGPLSDVYFKSDSAGTLAFEVTRHDDGVVYWPAGQQNIVVQIRVLQLAMDANFATAATGNIAGVCSGF